MIVVFYDGGCGLCSREIHHYQRIAPEGVFTWVDIATTPMPFTSLGYAIVRQPLSRKAATRLALCFSIFGFILFAIIHAALEEKPGAGFVWFLMFFVSRFILTLDQKPRSTSHTNLNSHDVK